MSTKTYPENSPGCDFPFILGPQARSKPAKIEGFAQPMKLEIKPNVRRKAQQSARPPAA